MTAAVALLRDQIKAKLGFRPHTEESVPSVAGEVPRGALSEIAGPGRTSVLHSLLAATTGRQEFCALLDTEDRFDPESAEAGGVRLAQVLWIRCGGNVEHALKAADMLAQSGGFGLVAIDLGDTCEEAIRRIPIAAWFRLRHGVENTRTALVVSAQQMHARSCSALKIALALNRVLWMGRAPGRLFHGFEIAALCTRNHRSEARTFEVTR